ncbi:hypothetical protein [Cardinium endosymbiont of Bemisia tabaci]|uniref:hypothetical protein n=1 Tax=Cardinium endosymbiont of Bemisia tabaci TaxID=672794 RepID=UPI000442D324|nr:hypothetical protein [Cardinium endosymbiont of Bemisia tabaci]CDG49662.1 Hypothetical protein CHV_a0347 [Cardinium endosymbiont cBtQ1 of Bemisia tabaci]
MVFQGRLTTQNSIASILSLQDQYKKDFVQSTTSQHGETAFSMADNKDKVQKVIQEFLEKEKAPKEVVALLSDSEQDLGHATSSPTDSIQVLTQSMSSMSIQGDFSANTSFINNPDHIQNIVSPSGDHSNQYPSRPAS